MKNKVLLALLFFLTFTSVAFAQSTLVSGTITDTDGQVWLNGTYQFQFVGVPGFGGVYGWTGGAFNPNAIISGSLDGAGSLTNISVPSSTAIAPAGSKWRFQVCPAGTGSCYSTVLVITGGSQSISSSVIPPAIRVSPTGASPTVAYADTEIIGNAEGSSYFNFVSGALRVFHLGTWTSITGGGGGIGTLNGLIAASQTFAVGTAGTDFGINSVGSVHTFNIPSASASNRGLLLAVDWTTFNAKLSSPVNLATQVTGILAASNMPATTVNSVNNDTNVTGVIATQQLTLGWTGTLAKSRTLAVTVYTDQTNVFGAFLQDFTSSSLKIPNSAGATPTTNALIAYDTTSNRYEGGLSGANVIFPWFVTGTPVNGQAVTWSGTNGAMGSAAFLSNPMTTLGDEIVGGSAGAPTRVAGPTTPAGVPQIWTSTPSGGVATTQAWALGGVPIRANTATTDTIAVTDRASYISESNAGSIAVTLPQAGSAGFGSNFPYVTCGIGTGTATITPTTSTISYTNGSTYTSAAANMALTTGQCAFVYSNNTDYFAIKIGGGGGSGTVTSVAETFTGGLISVAGSPITTSGTFALTVAGTSGGIPYFNSATSWLSSGALTVNLPVLGGGAGGAPTVGTVTGNTTQFATWTGATTASRCVHTDASGNLIIAASDCNTGAPALSAITAATGSNTIANGNNPQTWNWAQTTDAQDALTLGETTAATGGTLTNALGNQALLNVATLSGSTAVPLEVVQGGITATTGPPAVQIETTWNNASLVGEGLLFNVTNTSSAAGSRLWDFRVANVTQGYLDKAGNAAFLTSVATGATPPACTAGTAGFFCAGEGTAFTNVASTAGIYPDSTQHEWMALMNGASTAGLLVRAQPGRIHSTGNTALISTATLCAASAGACNTAGLYTVDWAFTQGGTACATPGTGGVTFLLTWTDANGTAHSAISLSMDDSASLVATTATFHFTTSNATAWASGSFNIYTNGSIIQYATGYTACTSGTGNYALDATVTRKGTT